MVSIAESANIARGSVLRHFADLTREHPELDGAQDLSWPGDNYAKAASLVWLLLRQEADRQNAEPMTGDHERKGFVVKGVNYRDAISILWPTMPRSDVNRSQQAVHKILTSGNNYATLTKERSNPRNGTPFKLGEYWVADEWQTPDVQIKRLNRPPGSTPRSRKTEADASPVLVAGQPEPAFVESLPESVEAEPTVTAQEFDTQLVYAYIHDCSNDELRKVMDAVQAEFNNRWCSIREANENLRKRIENIKSALRETAL